MLCESLLYYNVFPSTQLTFKYNINAICFDLWQSSSGWFKNRLIFHRLYFVHLGSHMPYTVQYCEVTYLQILLYVMSGTWCERCYLLAVVLPLRDSLQGWVGGSSYCFIHLRSCLSLLIVLVRPLYCFLSVIAELGVFNMYSAVTFWVMLSTPNPPLQRVANWKNNGQQ